MKESQLHKADFADNGVLYTESLRIYPRNTTKQHRQEVRKPRLLTCARHTVATTITY